MNHGPLLFLSALVSLSLSWFGFIFIPTWQLGGDQPEESVETGQMYPSPRPGLAQQGAEVYRANGCYYCHSQQVTQEQSDFDLSLIAIGPNPAALGRVLSEEVRPDLALAAAVNALGRLPIEIKGLDREFAEYFTNKLMEAGATIKVATVVAAPSAAKPGEITAPSVDTYSVIITSAGKNTAEVAKVLLRIRPSFGSGVTLPVVLARGLSKEDLDKINKKLTTAGAKTQVKMNLRGVDMDRGWGRRRSVALDYLYDPVVMVGSQRMGPDLSNIGDRQHSRVWHLSHLYDPRIITSEESNAGVDSLMPAYPYLFTKRPRSTPGTPGHQQAIRLAGEQFEVVPKPEAEALVAYLQSLRSGPGLVEAPTPKAPAPAAPPAALAPPGATPPSAPPVTPSQPAAVVTPAPEAPKPAPPAK